MAETIRKQKPVHRQVRPSDQAYGELQQAYDYLNATLFSGELPACMITVQREKRTRGYHSKNRWGTRDGERADEIAMNPSFFGIQPIEHTLADLAHQMTHLWQHLHGTPGRGRYHNKEWADKMQSIGLIPSHTGEEGGKTVGDHMSQYIEPGGRFEQALKTLVDSHYRLTWADRYPSRKAMAEVINVQLQEEEEGEISEGLDIAPVEDMVKNKGKTKYTCPACRTNAWGKQGLRLICGECGSAYVNVEELETEETAED